MSKGLVSSEIFGKLHIFFSYRDFHIILDLVIKRGKKLQHNNTACKKSHLVSH